MGKQWIHADRLQAGTHRGEDRRGKDHFLWDVAVAQHVEPVMNCLESEAVFSATLEDRVEARLAIAREAIGPIDETRLIKVRAIKNPVCNTESGRCQCWKT